MNIKSNLQLLSEAAAYDTAIDTKSAVRLDTVREAYRAIPEAPEATVTEAADVVVTATVDGDYYVEMTNLAPFMMDSGIKSIARALDLVAEANLLPERSVGLVVESQSYVDSTLENARVKADSTGNPRILESAINKVNKNNAIIAKLLSEGYKVAKKNDDAKVCPECGKAKCKCRCGDGKKCSSDIEESALLLEAKVFKDKKQLKAELDKLEKGPKPIETIGKYAAYFAKGLAPSAGGYAGIKGVEALATAGKISTAAAGPAMIGIAAASVIIYIVMDCCTRIDRLPGSISDKKVEYKRLLSSIDASIKAWKKKDSDNAEKMVKKLEEAKAKVESRLNDLHKAGKGKNLYYQNIYPESTVDELLSFDDIKLD